MMKRDSAFLLAVFMLGLGHQVLAEEKPKPEEEKAKVVAVDFPCFCPQIPYSEGYIGPLHVSSCMDEEWVWYPGSLECPLYCDMGLGTPGTKCDCIAALTANQKGAEKPNGPKTATPKTPKKYPKNVTFEDIKKDHPHGSPDTEEMCFLYLKLIPKTGDPRYIRASQLLRKGLGSGNANVPASLYWGGVELDGDPGKIDVEIKESEANSTANLIKNEYRVLTYEDQMSTPIERKVAIAKVATGRRNFPVFLVTILIVD